MQSNNERMNTLQALFHHDDDSDSVWSDEKEKEDNDFAEHGQHENSDQHQGLNAAHTEELIPQHSDEHQFQEQLRQRREVLGVLLDEITVGGNIASQLWPAAEFLATFVIDLLTTGSTITRRTMPLPADRHEQGQQEHQPVGRNQQQHRSNKDAEQSSRYSENDNPWQSVDEFLSHFPTVSHHEMNNGSTSTTSPNICTSSLSSPVSPMTVLPIIELGAGLGLVGLALAIHIPNVQVLLTDLEDQLPLLQNNVNLNQDQLRLTSNIVQVDRLHWGDTSNSTTTATPITTTTQNDLVNTNDCHCRGSRLDDVQRAIDWYESISQNSRIPPRLSSSSLPLSSSSMQVPTNTQLPSQPQHPPSLRQPLLIVGSDCVYWEELHYPLEYTLYQLLSRVPKGSLCLLASVRRWKRDTTFYKTIGKRTRHLAASTTVLASGPSNVLQCTLLQEQIQWVNNDTTVGSTNSNDSNTSDDWGLNNNSSNIMHNQHRRRQILRIYAIRMVESSKKDRE